MSEKGETNVPEIPEQSTRTKTPNTSFDQEAIRAEKALELKTRRAGHKSTLTRMRNELIEMMESGSGIEEVKLKVLDLNASFEKFSEVHKLYCSYCDVQKCGLELTNYFHQELAMFNGIKEMVEGWLAAMACKSVEPVGLAVRAEDSASQVGMQSRVSRLSSSSRSWVRMKQVEAEATCKALEAELSILTLKQQLAERKFHLQQEEKILGLKAYLAQTAAREQVYAKADAEENGYRAVEVGKEFDHPPIDSKPMSGDYAVKKAILDPTVPAFYSEEKKPNPVPSESSEHLDALLKIQQIQMKCIQDLAVQQHQSAMALTLPKPDLPVFNGNPIEYCDFVRAFDCLIEAKTDSSSSRLYYLIQYTRGEVQELMRSCLSMNPDEGYAEARRLLKSKYGQNYKIATAFVDKVTKGPSVKAEDPKALQNLSVLLISCKNTLNEIGHRNNIENPDSLKAVVERLPYDLRRRWRTVADNISEVQDRGIKFDYVVNFIEKEARVASHPLFGSLTSKPPEKDNKNISKNQPTSANRQNFAINANHQAGHRGDPLAKHPVLLGTASCVNRATS